MFEVLEKFAQEHGLSIGEKELSQFELFENLLLEKNKVMNLTAITKPKEVEIKHFVDSLEAAVVIKKFATTESFRVIDVGCGAGFPGIPLKIAFPKAEFVLLDSLNKRINFVNETTNLMNLSGIRATAARAEDFGRSAERETFDFCVSRAVARLNVLLEYTLPLVKVGGYCILYKSGNYEEEVKEIGKALKTLGGELKGVKVFTLPSLDEGETEGDGRSLVIIRKIAKTPSKYPRQAGKPSREPLK